MRHHRIQQSKRHKKFKSVEEPAEFRTVKDHVLQKTKDQPMPRKLLEIIQLKQNQHQNSVEERRRKKAMKANKKYTTLCVKPAEKLVIEKGMTRVPKPLPEKLEKGYSESDNHFLRRINRLVAKSMAEANLEEHFDVDLGQKIAPDNDSQVEDTDAKAKQKKRDKNKLKKLQQKKNKLMKQRKLIRQFERNDQELFKQEEILFGEVTHCPPTFNFNNNNKNNQRNKKK